jgi:hypothetical protein
MSSLPNGNDSPARTGTTVAAAMTRANSQAKRRHTVSIVSHESLQLKGNGDRTAALGFNPRAAARRQVPTPPAWATARKTMGPRHGCIRRGKAHTTVMLFMGSVAWSWQRKPAPNLSRREPLP